MGLKQGRKCRGYRGTYWVLPSKSLILIIKIQPLIIITPTVTGWGQYPRYVDEWKESGHHKDIQGLGGLGVATKPKVNRASLHKHKNRTGFPGGVVGNP